MLLFFPFRHFTACLPNQNILSLVSYHAYHSARLLSSPPPKAQITPGLVPPLIPPSSRGFPSLVRLTSPKILPTHSESCSQIRNMTPSTHTPIPQYDMISSSSPSFNIFPS
ncbi:hypothetical protein BDQ12DRAFT_676947 [Crucibulum laeve]|uniref:Uncharacterized protein n=1 Tax=Crucibulum laeve TaxID=68775 RepID=A0A5C3MBV0_9AGAR|nr:hypothetical protein BDQ12DRAFT_676947 [Crucibulum laeve]